MEILPGVHHFDTGPFNWYLLEDQGRLTLIDAGFPGHYRVFLEGLEQLGKTPKDVEAVILTHAHADHTGFAERLRNQSSIAVFIHQDDASGVRQGLNLPWYGLLSNSWRSHIRKMLLHATGQGVFGSPGVKTVATFQDGETLQVPGQPQAIHVPGHTPGEVVFFLPERGVLFSGDTLVTLNLMTGQRTAPQLPHRLLNSNDRQAEKSLSRLTELGQVTLLPGHGKAWSGMMADAVQGAHQARSDSPEQEQQKPADNGEAQTQHKATQSAKETA